jgi:mono/diheme cytochrome c family protein
VPSYADAARNITVGSTYHTIYYGLNSMGSYAGQINYEERWQVAEYVMQLKQDLTK